MKCEVKYLLEIEKYLLHTATMLLTTLYIVFALFRNKFWSNDKILNRLLAFSRSKFFLFSNMILQTLLCNL